MAGLAARLEAEYSRQSVESRRELFRSGFADRLESGCFQFEMPSGTSFSSVCAERCSNSRITSSLDPFDVGLPLSLAVVHKFVCS